MYGKTLILDAFWVDNKHFPTFQPQNSNHGRVFHDYYLGDARHLGWMDLVLLKEMIHKNSINHIILQNLDTLGKIAKIIGEAKVCVAYEFNRCIVHSLPKEKELAHCYPIYQDVVIGGWEFSEDANEIPARAQRYMRHLLIHTRVDSIICMTSKIKFTTLFDVLGNVIFETEPNL